METAPTNDQMMPKNISLPYTTRSTAKSAFADPFNIVMLGAFGLLAIATLLLSVTAFTGIVFLVFIASVCFICIYLWAILNREITITEQGFFYREAFRRVSFKWDEIETIKIELAKGQITFYSGGKASRIHEFGLPQDGRKRARETLIATASSNGIPIK